MAVILGQYHLLVSLRKIHFIIYIRIIKHTDTQTLIPPSPLFCILPTRQLVPLFAYSSPQSLNTFVSLCGQKLMINQSFPASSANLFPQEFFKNIFLGVFKPWPNFFLRVQVQLVLNVMESDTYNMYQNSMTCCIKKP